MNTENPITIIPQIPCALFNSKAQFNAYQYEPFIKIFDFKNNLKWNNKNLFITDEVGVGKTFEAGIIIKQVNHNAKSINKDATILIICPAKLCKQWKDELKEFFNIEFKIFDGKYVSRLLIVPYSRLNNDKIKNYKYDLLILDEAHYIRNINENTKKTAPDTEVCPNESDTTHNFIKKLIENNDEKLRVFMTATPIFNSEDDYKNITSLLSLGEKEFETTTTLQGEANLYEFQLNIQNKPINYEEGTREYRIINKVMNKSFGSNTGFIRRITTSSIYSLKNFLDNYENNKNKDGEGYFDNLDPNINTIIELKDSIDKIYKDTENEHEDIKFNNLINLIDNIKNSQCTANTTKGIIIFSSFIDTGKYLYDKLREDYNNTLQISGSSFDKDISKNIQAFKDEVTSKPNEVAILICSDAFKEGQNFQFCQNLIHYDFPFTPAALSQRNGRIYRKGIVAQPNIYYMTVNNSYDNRLFGEIIVNKTRIIADHANNNKVSIINVLPNDSEDFFKKSIEDYFNNKVEEKNKEKDNEKDKEQEHIKTIEDNKYNIEKSVFMSQIKNKFLRESKNFNFKTSSEVYDFFNIPTNNTFLDAFIKIFYNVSSGDSLIETYKEKNKDQHDKINNLFFGENSKDFITNCEEYLKNLDVCTDKHKFCHDLLKDGNIDFEVYKKEFKSLISITK